MLTMLLDSVDERNPESAFKGRKKVAEPNPSIQAASSPGPWCLHIQHKIHLSLLFSHGIRRSLQPSKEKLPSEPIDPRSDFAIAFHHSPVLVHFVALNHLHEAKRSKLTRSSPEPCSPTRAHDAHAHSRDRKSTRLNSSHSGEPRMPSSA